jgi:hypothetical protein
MARVRTDSGRRLNHVWGVNAQHALYHKDGIWYERLERFPGALFDENGYVLFESEMAFVRSSYLRITEKVKVPEGIAQMPEYRRMRSSGPGSLSAELESLELADAFEEGGVKFQLHRRKERNRRAVQRKKEIVLARHGKLACEVCDFDFAQVYGPLGAEFAECHHRTPLADLQENHRTRLSELAIICANCHRMIHRSRPMVSVDFFGNKVSARTNIVAVRFGLSFSWDFCPQYLPHKVIIGRKTLFPKMSNV